MLCGKAKVQIESKVDCLDWNLMYKEICKVLKRIFQEYDVGAMATEELSQWV